LIGYHTRMSANLYRTLGRQAAMEKLGYGRYTDRYDYYDTARDYRESQRLALEQERAEREALEHRARLFAGKVKQNPNEFDNYKRDLTAQEIADARSASGTAGGILGGTLGGLAGMGLGALTGHSAGPVLGGLGGLALGGYGGYRLMEPLGEDVGRENAQNLIDLAHTHGLDVPAPKTAALWQDELSHVGLRALGGTAAGAGAGASPNEKTAFLGFNPNQLKHIGMRAAGGAAAGAGIGAASAGEGNRFSGAVTGGLVGGLTAGGLSAARKGAVNRATGQLDEAIAAAGNRPVSMDANTARMIQAVRNEPARVARGLENPLKTMGGGAAMGALPAYLAARE
jgi:hypothetical protein